VLKSSRRLEIFNRSDRLNLGILALISLIVFGAGTWRNGYAYTYYSAAAQAGSVSWKAFFFGSLDSANFITVDKPPVAVWLSALSVRIFGLHSFAILLPHILAGVGCVIILYLVVRRVFDKGTAFIAGILLIISPASVVVFRYNLTDSILILFILISIYCFLRALEDSQLWWLVASAAASGFAFNTKMTQGLIVVPVFVVMYFYNSNQRFLKNCLHILAYWATLIITSLWWSLIVSLTPASQRPWIGSTSGNSIWELIFVHNGFGRLFGSNWKQPTGQSGLGVAFGGEPGPFRMFNSGFGPNYVWFFGIAIIGVFIGSWAYRSAKNHAMMKNHIGVWFFTGVISGVLFSFTKGTIHPYYAISFAPGVAALCAIGLSTLFSKDVLKADRLYTHHFIFVVGAFTVLFFPILYLWSTSGWPRIVSIIALVSAGLATLMYVFYFIGKKVSFLQKAGLAMFSVLVTISIALTTATILSVQRGFMPTSKPLPEVYGRFQIPDQDIPKPLEDFLLTNYKGEKWIAASSSAIQTAPIQLSTKEPVMALGGFSANDNPMSLKEFQNLVKRGDLRYYAVNSAQVNAFQNCEPTFIREGKEIRVDKECSKGENEDSKSSAEIEKWVFSRFQVKNTSFRRWQVYDLSRST